MTTIAQGNVQQDYPKKGDGVITTGGKKYVATDYGKENGKGLYNVAVYENGKQVNDNPIFFLVDKQDKIIMPTKKLTTSEAADINSPNESLIRNGFNAVAELTSGIDNGARFKQDLSTLPETEKEAILEDMQAYSAWGLYYSIKK